jgi:uncharacterized repeat protein (TIGR03803 family)
MGQQASGIRARAHIALLMLAILFGLTMATVPAWGQTFKVLHTFTGSPDGMQPTSLLEMNGTLYGTTSSGGHYGFGTIFKVNSQGKESVLYSFTGGQDGANPIALVPDDKGNVYGVAQNGGNSGCSIIYPFTGCGVIFKVSSNSKLTVLYRFSGGTDGALPQGLVIGPSGDLYGVAEFGGDLGCGVGMGYGCGVVFRLSPSGNETVLYTFSNSADGALPGGLSADSAGNLFGTTSLGGSIGGSCFYGCGVVFELKTTGKEIPLYTFTDGPDGAFPNGSLLIDSKGSLYGTASAGGNLSGDCSFMAGCGLVFKVSTAGAETVLYTFSGPDGNAPRAGLLASKGKVYGDTQIGGVGNFGTVFVLGTNGEKVLYSFEGSTDGENPQSGLILDSVGNLYGTAYFGGDLSCNPPYGCGTVFRLAP